MKTVHLIPILLVVGLFTACSSDNDSTPSTDASTLESYLKSHADYVHSINGFYIVGSAKDATCDENIPSKVTGKQVFDHAVRLFSSYLDQNNDGVVDKDKEQLNVALKEHMLFYTGPQSAGDKLCESSAVTSKHLYGMTMQTDNWPYCRDYDGTGFEIKKLDSSTWRPENNFNALWEEVFHTITEAMSRTDSEFAFTTGAKLRQLMDADIAAGSYDISVQNKEENGQYDRVTAVNEYIHQIWAINYAGQNKVLNDYQTQTLNFMIAKHVPMTINASYNKTLGVTIK